MKDIKAIRGRSYILDLISQGEHEQQDFKYAISDARKIARSLSAFANHSGGHLLIGVKDNGVIAGVRSEEDIYMIEQAAQLYCVPEQEVTFQAYSTGDSGIVIKASIGKAYERPVCVKEVDKKLKAYYRVGDENIVAHPLMVKTWRLQASQSGSSLSMQGACRDIMCALQNAGHLSIEQAIRSTHASRRSAETAIVRLASFGTIAFVYRDGQFYLDLP